MIRLVLSSFAFGIVLAATAQAEPGPNLVTAPVRSAQSAAATSLPHILLVPASGSPSANGKALLTAVASANGATAAAPYVIQLDAGTYALPVPSSGTASAGLMLPAFVSVRGAGMLSSFVTSSDNGFIYLGSQTSEAIASIADLTVSASGGYALHGEGFSSLLVEHVRVNGYVDFHSSVSEASLRVTDSVLNGPTAISISAGHAVLSATEVLSFFNTGYTPGVLACFSVYNANLQPYPAACISSAP